MERIWETQIYVVKHDIIKNDCNEEKQNKIRGTRQDKLEVCVSESISEL